MILIFNFHSDPLFAITAIAAIVLVFFIIKIHLNRVLGKKGRRRVVAGTVFNQFLNFHRLHDYMTDLASKHKTYRLLSFSRSEVYTADPVNVEYILKTNFANYGKGQYQYEIWRDLLGDGIFTVDGEKWHHQRKMASYQFSSRLLREYSSSVFKSIAVKLASIVAEASISNQIIEVQNLFAKSTMDSVFQIVLGVELDTLCGTYEEGTMFSNAFDEASAITILRYIDIFWKIKRFLNIGSEASLKKYVRKIDEFVYQVIKIKTEKVQKSEDKPERKDLLSRLLEFEETDPKYLKDIILSFIIAGKDTTATTLSWFFYLLCKHPHVQEKIAHDAKIATGLQDFSTIEELATSITEDVIEKMQYLHAALTETLRLYPAVPWDAKICFSHDTLPDG